MLRIWTRSYDVIWWKVIWQILCSVLPRLKQILFHFNYLLAATALITLAHSFDHSSSIPCLSFDQSSSMLLKLQKSFINIPSFLLCNCSFSFPPPTPSHMHFNHHYLHWKVTLNQARMLKQSTFCVCLHPLLSSSMLLLPWWSLDIIIHHHTHTPKGAVQPLFSPLKSDIETVAVETVNLLCPFSSVAIGRHRSHGFS